MEKISEKPTFMFDWETKMAFHTHSRTHFLFHYEVQFKGLNN